MAQANVAETNSATGKMSLDSVVAVKEGMTRIFDENGNHVPVTVLRIIPNVITQIKTSENDGYSAYQVAYGEKREKLITKPTKGQLKKAGTELNATRFYEIKADSVDASALGKWLSTYIDVTSTSKGKGFQGVVKKYHFSGGPATHGSMFHRRPGAIGNRAVPARVFPEKKMPGHMGSERVTVQNLVVVAVNEEKGYLLIRGSVPGSKKTFIRITKATKKQ
jgi:large subunit ribosomal protein L3